MKQENKIEQPSLPMAILIENKSDKAQEARILFADDIYKPNYGNVPDIEIYGSAMPIDDVFRGVQYERVLQSMKSILLLEIKQTRICSEYFKTADRDKSEFMPIFWIATHRQNTSEMRMPLNFNNNNTTDFENERVSDSPYILASSGGYNTGLVCTIPANTNVQVHLL